MRAGVEEAHKAGRRVAAHAYIGEAINNAIEAGVDSIEHGSFLDSETARRMAGQGTYLVPTMSVYEAMSEKGEELGSPEYITRKTAKVLASTREGLARALEAGVKVAAGTDCGAPGHPHGMLAQELRLMSEAGARPAGALDAGTRAAADLLGLAGEVGMLESGKRADLIAVGGDLLTDIEALEDVRLVVRGGVEMYDKGAKT